MASLWESICDGFWSSSFWLPAGVSWKDLENTSQDVYYPQLQDLKWSFAVGVLLLVIRYLYESVIIVPIAKALGLRDRKRHVTPNPILEKEYTRLKGKTSQKNLELLSKKTELSVREIERWFWKRKLNDAPSPMMKFREVSWHFIFYICSFVYGMYILWHRNWFWEIKYCVIGWPKLHVDEALYLFYLVELGFYWSLIISSLTDVKRSDFVEQMTHHLLTISLICLSWVLNYVRYGAIIMVLHDVSDYWLAAGKMAKYSKRQTICEVLFACFIVVWLVSRIGLYPFWVVRFIMFDMHEYNAITGVTHKIFVGLLCGLQVLHIIWTYLILKIALQKFTHGEIKNDVRSDSEGLEDSSDDDSAQEPQANSTNGPVMSNRTQAKVHVQ